MVFRRFRVRLDFRFGPLSIDFIRFPLDQVFGRTLSDFGPYPFDLGHCSPNVDEQRAKNCGTRCPRQLQTTLKHDFVDCGDLG